MNDDVTLMSFMEHAVMCLQAIPLASLTQMYPATWVLGSRANNSTREKETENSSVEGNERGFVHSSQ